MPKRFTYALPLFSLILLISVCPAWAQKAVSQVPLPSSTQVQVSDRAPELSDADKKKLAEIGQRPEVKAEIQATWDDLRRRELEFVYALNSSTHLTDISSPQYAEFRENYGQLYDNPILQRYVNNIGQRLVPKDSPNIYAFKLLLDPVPRAEALSTGTVLVSTGMIALLDNEAQLAYVLGHEIAHIEKGHHYTQIRNEILQRELNVEKEKSAEKKKVLFGAITTGASAAIGGIAGGGRGALFGAGAGFIGGSIAEHFLFRSKVTVTEWSVIDENEADEAGLKYMLDMNYDARQIPGVYAHLDKIVTKDARVSLGFIGSPIRMKERLNNIGGLLGTTLKANIDAKLKAGGLIGSTPDFPVLMSALKRDNGIIALDYDLFAMARDNLEEAVSLRSNDARAQSYLGKTIALTARTEEDRQQAASHFMKAIQYDEGRGFNADPHLERAVFLISQQNPAGQPEICKELQTYVILYQRQHAGQLPNNMAIIYDYLTLAGDSTWYVPPAAEVATRYGESLKVNNSGTAAPAGIQQIMDKKGPDGNESTPRKKSVPARPTTQQSTAQQPTAQPTSAHP